jgi:hypothetical protein
MANRILIAAFVAASLLGSSACVSYKNKYPRLRLHLPPWFCHKRPQPRPSPIAARRLTHVGIRSKSGSLRQQLNTDTATETRGGHLASFWMSVG